MVWVMPSVRHLPRWGLLVAEPGTKAQYVAEQLKARSLKNTPANRKMLQKEYDEKYLGGASDDWRTRFRLEFPQYADLVDGAEGETKARATFGDDLIDLFYDAARNPNKYDFVSDAGLKAWGAKVQATKFYQNVLPNQRTWDLTPKNQQTESLEREAARLRADFGTLELSDSEVAELSLYSLRNQANELQTKYFAFSLVGKRANQTKTGISATDQSKQLKLGLKAFDYNPPDIDNIISAALTGTKYNGTMYTPELLESKAKNGAKIMYKQFANLIDQGYTLDDIFDPYKQLAAKTLELNPNTITRDNPLFKNVLDMVDEKNEPISGTEFVYRLKKDPKYNYNLTQQANTEMDSIIRKLETAFGLYS